MTDGKRTKLELQGELNDYIRGLTGPHMYAEELEPVVPVDGIPVESTSTVWFTEADVEKRLREELDRLRETRKRLAQSLADEKHRSTKMPEALEAVKASRSSARRRNSAAVKKLKSSLKESRETQTLLRLFLEDLLTDGCVLLPDPDAKDAIPN